MRKGSSAAQRMRKGSSVCLGRPAGACLGQQRHILKRLFETSGHLHQGRWSTWPVPEEGFHYAKPVVTYIKV